MFVTLSKTKTKFLLVIFQRVRAILSKYFLIAIALLILFPVYTPNVLAADQNRAEILLSPQCRTDTIDLLDDLTRKYPAQQNPSIASSIHLELGNEYLRTDYSTLDCENRIDLAKNSYSMAVKIEEDRGVEGLNAYYAGRIGNTYSKFLEKYKDGSNQKLLRDQYGCKIDRLFWLDYKECIKHDPRPECLGYELDIVSICESDPTPLPLPPGFVSADCNFLNDHIPNDGRYLGSTSYCMKCSPLP